MFNCAPLWSDREMSRTASIFLLLVASLLEAGGDASVRRGLSETSWRRVLWFLLGGVILFGYGYIVNRPPWKFGELLGLYVVFFFVAAQVQAWAFFNEAPSGAVLAGGAFIVTGGLIIALWR